MCKAYKVDCKHAMLQELLSSVVEYLVKGSTIKQQHSFEFAKAAWGCFQCLEHVPCNQGNKAKPHCFASE